MIERGAPPWMGYELDNLTNPQDGHWISDFAGGNARVEMAFPYLSRLSGFKMRYVYALSDPGKPPLPPGPYVKPATQP